MSVGSEVGIPPSDGSIDDDGDMDSLTLTDAALGTPTSVGAVEDDTETVIPPGAIDGSNEVVTLADGRTSSSSPTASSFT